MSPGWLGLRDILRLSRGRWGSGPAPRWLTAGPTGHRTLYSPPVLPPLLAQGSLDSAGQFWGCVCVCACMHTCGAGRQGQRAGREHRGQSGQGSRPLQGQLPTARASFLQDTRFPGQEAKRQGPATLYNKGVHSPVVQWLRLHAPSREFDPWSGN